MRKPNNILVPPANSAQQLISLKAGGDDFFLKFWLLLQGQSLSPSCHNAWNEVYSTKYKKGFSFVVVVIKTLCWRLYRICVRLFFENFTRHHMASFRLQWACNEHR